MNVVPLVVASLRRHPLRVALTVLSIAAAFILYAYLAAIQRAFSMGADVAGTNRLVVRSTLGVKLLPLRYEERIEQIEGVVEATPLTFFGGRVGTRNTLFSQFPLWPDEFRRVYPEFVISDEELARWLETRTGAIVGRATARRLDLQTGDHLLLGSRLWRTRDDAPWDFEIVGIYHGAEKGTDETLMFFRQDYFDENRIDGSGLIMFVMVIVNDPANAAAVATSIDARFRNSDAETRTESEAAFLNSLASQVGHVGTLAVGIMSAVFFTILLVVGNTMMQSFRERVSELGLLKAIGYPDTLVAGIVMTESLSISLAGGVTGLSAGAWLIGRGDPTGGMLPAFHLQPGAVVLGVLLMLILGVLSGLVPGLQAVRLQPAVALRKE